MSTVRVEPRLHEKLRALSAAEHRSISQVIEEAVDRYQKEKFWAAMHEGFARLRSDSKAWGEYQDEAALWERMSGDGPASSSPTTSSTGRHTPSASWRR